MDDSKSSAHGSCVLTRAVGIWGSSRSASVTIVRTDWGPDATTTLKQQIASAFTQVLEDIRTKRLQKKSVVSFSYDWLDQLGGPMTNLDEDPYDRAMYILLEQLVAEEAVLVVASGNDGEAEDSVVSTAPIVWSGDLGFITTAATSDAGQIAGFSQWLPSRFWPFSGVATYAPGIDVECPLQAGTGVQYKSGSSFGK